MSSYFLVYKPYGYLSQFTKEEPDHVTLADLDFDFPKDVYPVGRLDKDSEGLLLLTDDSDLNHRLLNPKFKHWRSYLVQVEGSINAEAVETLKTGVEIRIKKKNYRTLPATCEVLPYPPALPDRDPPIRFRKNVPTAWIKLTLHEGKNRQVRRMCAGVGFPVLRLVRTEIEKVGIGDLSPGDVREMSRVNIYKALNMAEK